MLRLVLFAAHNGALAVILSALQRKTLELYRTFRESPPTIGKLMSMSVIQHIALLMALSATIGIALAANQTHAAAALVGMGFGAICRDLGIFIRSVRLWPILNLIIDWKKVDSLLDGEPS